MPDSSEPPLPDAQCLPFLQWALPRMAFRWPGFRNVRRQVRRRLRPRGFLAVGSQEELPEGARGFTPWPEERCRYRLAG